ncbi:hypothetical protein FRB90_004204 [Tulasnella sp. 427]|nr:hypothetical protein FRB90_004204 [Tulasnella sp. 427]
MPNLCNIRVSHMMRGAINLLLSSIQAPQCRRVVASPLDLTTLPRYQRHLNTLLTKIATFTEEIHVEIGGSNVRHALLSSWEPPSLDSVPFLNGQPGFFFVFQADNLAQDFKNLISFIAYTQTPISLSIESRSHHVKVAIEQIDWDQLPSLRQLKIRSCFSLQPIFLKLSQPRGPRHAMRWPCPQLSVLKLVGYDRVNDGFVMFLANRWGGRGREGSGMTRDPISHSYFLLPRHEQAIQAAERVLTALVQTPGASIQNIHRMHKLRVDHTWARNVLLPLHTLGQELPLDIWEEIAYDSALEGVDGVWALAQVSKL